MYKENVSEELIFIYHKGNFEKLRKILADTNWGDVKIMQTDANRIQYHLKWSR